MKKCPVCQTIYGREDLEFCLKDSAELVHVGPEEAAHVHEMHARAAYQPPPPQYAVSPPVVTAPAPQVIRQGVSPAVLVALVALLLFVFAGGAVALLLRAYWSRPAETAQATPPQPVATATATPQQQVIVVKQAAPPAPKPAPAAPARFYGGSYPEGSARYLTDGDLSGRGCWELKIMRNEIYARRGYIFKTQDMIAHFNSQGWYRPVRASVALSGLEQRNVSRIQSYEAAYGCR